MTNDAKGRRFLTAPCSRAAAAFVPLIAAVAALSACSAAPADPLGASSGNGALVRPLSPAAGAERRAFGAHTGGGVTGEVLRVTNLRASGPGSLRAALEADGPRLVVFETGGVIDLGGRTLVVRHPGLTLAGQTAPDPGVTLIRGSLIVETDDVVIQHIAVRPGDGEGAFSDWTPDALGARRGSEPVHDVVFDHCSATWAVDENLSVSGPADRDVDADPDATSHNVTLQHCLIAEGLSHSTHSKGEHSKGTLLHDGVRDVAIIGCLYAHNHERNPRLKGSARAVVAGSVMYNWSSACVGVGVRGNERMLKPAEGMLTGNVAIAGPDTKTRLFVKGVDPGGRVFLANNIAVDVSGSAIPLLGPGVVSLPSPPAWAPSMAAPDAWTATERVLRTAGSRPARRDPIDARIVRSVIEGTGRIIDSQEQVGGYPVRGATSRVLVVPDGQEARRRWLEALSAGLESDPSLDLTPLWNRLRVRAPEGR